MIEDEFTNILENKFKNSKDNFEGGNNLVRLVENITKDVYELKKKNPEIIDTDEYKRFTLHLNDFFKYLADYYDIIAEDSLELDASLNSEERQYLIKDIESKDARKKSAHDLLMTSYINILYYYQYFFGKEALASLSLPPFFYNKEEGLKAKYERDKKGNIVVDLEAIDKKERGEFGEYFINCYKNLDDDEESKEVFNDDAKLIENEWGLIEKQMEEKRNQQQVNN